MEFSSFLDVELDQPNIIRMSENMWAKTERMSEKACQKPKPPDVGRFWVRGLNSSVVQAGGGHFYEDVGTTFSPIA
jgi:hypothetical protein